MQTAPVPNGAITQQPDPSQKEIYDQLIDLLSKRRRTLEDCLSCGELLCLLRKANPGYGDSWMDSACAALQGHGFCFTRSFAYRLVGFSDLFSNDNGRELIKDLRELVSWESVTRVLPVEGSTKREAILREAAEKGLSSRQVRALIRERTV